MFKLIRAPGWNLPDTVWFLFALGASISLLHGADEPLLSRGEVVLESHFDGAEPFQGWAGPVRLETGWQSAHALVLQTDGPTQGAVVSRRLPVQRLRGSTLRGVVMVKAEEVTAKPNPWNGIKFMLAIETPERKLWPQAPIETGSFDWRRAAFTVRIPTNATAATLHLGLEQVTGKVWFDNVKLTVAQPPRAARPAPHPGPVFKGHNLPRLRGAMIGPRIDEAGLRILGQDWKANLIRWQLIRHGRPGQPSSLDDYDSWLEGELRRLDAALPLCEKYGLYVALDLHSPPGGKATVSGYIGSDDRLFTDRKVQDKFVEVWRRLAARYKDAKAIWGYDLANEPVEDYVEDDCDDWHALAERTARAIREIDPARAIICEAPPWGSPDSLAEFTPIAVSNVVYSAHMYVPGEFTHQGVHRPTDKPVYYPGIIHGKPWDKEALRAALQPVIDFQKTYNVHIYLGEFSAIRWAPGDSACRYLRDVIDLFEEHGWDWSYHAFREWQGWSVEHGSDRQDTRPAAKPTDRQQLLLEWFARNQKPQFRAPRTAAPTAPEPAAPLPDHPGNVFLEDEAVHIPLPESLPAVSTPWRLADDRRHPVRSGVLSAGSVTRRETMALGRLNIGWYRLEFGVTNQPPLAWTTLAVLRRQRAPIPADSPIAVDSAAAWFARDDAAQQKQLANLAALAGVRWVRDRLRWRDLQPQPGELKPPPTTYDTSAEAHREAGLSLLQVFHDTPLWTQEGSHGSGRFAPDLRHAYQFSRALATRFKGRVAAWEPWNEANVATFGAHTVDQMCSWQKAAWLGFKSGDPEVIVGWNATAAVPTPAHTEGVLANETWPYFDTYNIHTYDGSHAYADLWQPAREAAAGRPLWITEADRGTPHLKNAPWFDQAPRLERLKAEWMAQSYASSLFAGAERHFHFILGNYQEPHGVQFGLLRLDLTPRPAYVALAAVGRCLAGARILGRWRADDHVQGYAFRARPDGQERDVLVVWAEKEADWNERGLTTVQWTLPAHLTVQEWVDYLGRPLGQFPAPLTSAPVFVFLPPGQAASLPLEKPPALAPPRSGARSPVVLQMSLPRAAVRKVEDLPWSEGYAYQVTPGETLDFKLHAYNFGTNAAAGDLQVVRQPAGWSVSLSQGRVAVEPMQREEIAGALKIPAHSEVIDGWVILRAECGPHGQAALAFRVLARRMPK